MQDQENTILIVISAVLFLFSIAMVILLFSVVSKKKSMEQRMTNIIEKKSSELKLLREIVGEQEIAQEKLAFNLHNEIGPSMAVLKLNISRCYKLLLAKTLDPEELHNQRNPIDNIIENLHVISLKLAPLFLLKYGLVKALNKFVDSITEVHVSLESKLADDFNIPKHVSTQLYKMILEILKKSIQQDAPQFIQVLIYWKDLLIVEITHDGNSLSPDEMKRLSRNPSSLGLNSIFTHIVILDSNLEIWRDKNLNHIKISTSWTTLAP